MKRSLLLSRSAVLLAALAAVGAVGAGQHASARTARAAGATACTATGTYLVGQAPLPARPGGSRSVAPRGTGAQAGDVAAPAALTVPRGTLVVLSYAGCGETTRGTFSVRFVSPLPGGGRRGPLLPTMATRMETLSGTFAEATGASATGATGVSSVAVKATLSVSVPEAASGSRSTTTDTRVDATGTLRVADDGRSAVLTFAQPGSSSSASNIVLYGHRGTYRPIAGS